MDTPNFEYKNFIPTSAIADLCRSIYVSIRNRAPYDSYIHATIERMENGAYKTLIQVNALCGKFRSEAKENSVVDSVDRAKETFKEMMSEWKRTRFVA